MTDAGTNNPTTIMAAWSYSDDEDNYEVDEDLSRKCIASRQSKERSPWKLENSRKASSTSSETDNEQPTIILTPKKQLKHDATSSTPKKTPDRRFSRDFSLLSKRSSGSHRRRWSLNSTRKSSKYNWTGQFNHLKQAKSMRNSISYDEKTNFLSEADCTSKLGESIESYDKHSDLLSLSQEPDKTYTKAYRNDLNGDLNVDDENNWENETINDFNQYQDYDDDDDGDGDRQANDENKNWDFQEGIKSDGLRNRFETFRDKVNFMKEEISARNILKTDDEDLFIGEQDYEIGMRLPRDLDAYRAKNKIATEHVSVCKKMKDFLLTFFINVVMFAFLPIIYIAFFMYVHREDEG